MDVNLRRDGFVLLVLAVLTLMLAAAVTGAYRVFGYGFVALLGLLLAIGFARPGDRRTWWPPVLATSVLAVAFTGMFRFEAQPVRQVADTWLGFQAGTAFLIYGVWIPAFFTLGLSFALLFNRLEHGDNAASRRKGASR